MNVAALRHAGLAGLANRGVQAVSRALDRVAVRAGRPRYAPLDAAPDAGAPDPRRFFAGATDAAAVGWLRAALPDAVARTIRSADAALAGRFDLLGYRALVCGDPIDWHRDPVSGRRAPYLHWSLLDPLDHATLGDHKVTWELNRHQWFIDLGHAWRLTGERRYADAFTDAIQRWMTANEPGQGINWASSLEAAFRTISWCWALFLFDGDRALARRMRTWLAAHAQHVERYLSYYYSPNTHLTGEALGLFIVGTAFPDLPGARRWRRLGRRILVDEFDRQVHADGVYFEQAACYQRYTAEIYLHFIALAARVGEPAPDSVTDGVQRLLDALLSLRGPDGLLPAIGDDDGGMLLRCAGRAPREPAGVFAVAAALFGRADYAWAAGAPQAETAWLLGAGGIAAFAALQPTPPAVSPSRLLPDGGYAVMRSSWRDDAHQLIVDAGPLGCPVSGGHGHADLLALHCHAFGVPAIVDPGTGRYPTEGGWRRHFRETGAHSTITVDGLSQAESCGPFRWHERCAAQVNEWQSTPAHDLLDAEHDAYRRLADPVVHRRRVLFVKPRYWVVVDDLSGAGVHTVESHFQFTPEASLSARDGWTVAALGGDAELMVRAFCSEAPRALDSDGWVSPAYGSRVRAPALTFGWHTRMPLRCVTLIVPARAGAGSPLRSWRAQGDGYRFELDDHAVTVDDDTLRVERRDH